MTLTTRLSGYFLAFLAALLLAFSFILYALASQHLHRRQVERAGATLEAFVAAVEAEPDGLEWDRKERSLLIRHDDGWPLWAVFDAAGREVDGSDSAVIDALRPFADEDQPHRTVQYGGEKWGVSRRSFTDPNPDTVERRSPPGEPRRPAAERYHTLVFVVACPETAMRDTLRTLALSLAVVSIGVWMVAAVGSRWVCRRAIAPVSVMANAARRITADDLSARLPVHERRDELRDLAESFNDLLVRLREAFERQRRFTGEASHQLRTPLAALIGQVEVVLRRDRDEGEYRRVLTSVGGQAERLRQIVEMLLLLARADGEAMLPDARRINLREWMPAQLGESWGAHARFGDLRFVDGRSEPVWVRAQPVLLGQVIDNLIDNAIKYGPTAKPIRVELLVDGVDAVVRVVDAGPGIPQSDAGLVFEPFYRTSSARQAGVPGMGLGLAVSARIVRVFDGTIRVVHGPSGGSGVEFRLPLDADLG
ncbi:MAG: ATP-binding protein [Gemmataceae bacterium]